MVSTLTKNYKTFRSLDLSTKCIRIKNGHPCEYCYVQRARKIGYRAKTEYDRIPYGNDILRLKTKTVLQLNKIGGLRLFAFGDYEPWMKPHIIKIIDNAERKGLLLKAITKQLNFLEFCDKIFTNYSMDFVHGFPSFPCFEHPNLKYRVMVRNEDEVKQIYKEADILTPYHGPKINENYRPKEAKLSSIEHARNKTCCIVPQCIDCTVKCGRTIN